MEAGEQPAELEEGLSLVEVGNRSVLGVGWLVTEEENSSGRPGVAAMCSTIASPAKQERKYLYIFENVVEPRYFINMPTLADLGLRQKKKA